MASAARLSWRPQRIGASPLTPPRHNQLGQVAEVEALPALSLLGLGHNLLRGDALALPGAPPRRAPRPQWGARPRSLSPLCAPAALSA